MSKEIDERDVVINKVLLTQKEALMIEELVISALEFDYISSGSIEDIYGINYKERQELLNNIIEKFSREI